MAARVARVRALRVARDAMAIGTISPGLSCWSGVPDELIFVCTCLRVYVSAWFPKPIFHFSSPGS